MPDIVQENKIIINVTDCRAIVSRWTQWTQNGIGIQNASNWRELEEDAEEEILAQGGGINISNLYTCSEALAARARFDTP